MKTLNDIWIQYCNAGRIHQGIYPDYVMLHSSLKMPLNRYFSSELMYAPGPATSCWGMKIIWTDEVAPDEIKVTYDGNNPY